MRRVCERCMNRDDPCGQVHGDVGDHDGGASRGDGGGKGRIYHRWFVPLLSFARVKADFFFSFSFSPT